MKFLFPVLLWGMITQFVYGQDKGQIREANIKAQVLWVSEKKGLTERKYKSQELRYDSKGNCIEEIFYNRRGKMIRHRAFEYDKGLLVREFHLDAKGFIVTRTDYRYRNKVPVEKRTYNGKGELIKTVEMIYEYQD